MTDLKFDKEITTLLLIDPYNDFISEGGKIWDRIKTVAEECHSVNQCDETRASLTVAAVHAAV